MHAQIPDRQQRILEFLADYMGANGYPPTVREIGEQIGVKSTSLVSYYLNWLETHGRIIRDPKISRGLRLLDESGNEILTDFSSPTPDDVIAIPYYGYIVASMPLEVDPLVGDETIDVGRALLGRNTNDLFALKVQGDSMIDALISDGDTVIFRQQERVENGEMAAVWLDDPGATTLKRVFYEGAQVRLKPENPMMEAFYVPVENLRVQGTVVMVIRQLG